MSMSSFGTGVKNTELGTTIMPNIFYKKGYESGTTLLPNLI